MRGKGKKPGIGRLGEDLGFGINHKAEPQGQAMPGRPIPKEMKVKVNTTSDHSKKKGKEGK